MSRSTLTRAILGSAAREHAGAGRHITARRLRKGLPHGDGAMSRNPLSAPDRYARRWFLVAAAAGLALLATGTSARGSVIWGNNASLGKVTIEAFDSETGLLIPGQQFLLPNPTARDDNGRGIALLGNTIYYTTANSGNIYVTDTVTHADLGILVDTGFPGVANVATDGTFIYASSYQDCSGIINKYDTSGNLVGSVAVGPGFCDRDGFEAQKNPNLDGGATTFISNRGDLTSPYDVYRSDGSLLVSAFIDPAADGFDSRQTGIAYDGNHYFASAIYNNRLLEYDGHGAFIRSIDLSGNPYIGGNEGRQLEDLSAAGSTVTAEICDNGIDDDGDGLVDLHDPDCADAFLDGELVRDDTGGDIFIIFGNAPFRFADAASFSLMQFDLGDVDAVAADALAQLPATPTDGTVVKEFSSTDVFIVLSGERSRIPDLPTFLSLGFAKADIGIVPDGSLASIPLASPPTLASSPTAVAAVRSSGACDNPGYRRSKSKVKRYQHNAANHHVYHRCVTVVGTITKVDRTPSIANNYPVCSDNSNVCEPNGGNCRGDLTFNFQCNSRPTLWREECDRQHRSPCPTEDGVPGDIHAEVLAANQPKCLDYCVTECLLDPSRCDLASDLDRPGCCRATCLIECVGCPCKDPALKCDRAAYPAAGNRSGWGRIWYRRTRDPDGSRKRGRLAGKRVVIVGPAVTDDAHAGWAEIHPVWKVRRYIAERSVRAAELRAAPFLGEEFPTAPCRIVCCDGTRRPDFAAQSDSECLNEAASYCASQSCPYARTVRFNREVLLRQRTLPPPATQVLSEIIECDDPDQRVCSGTFSHVFTDAVLMRLVFQSSPDQCAALRLHVSVDGSDVGAVGPIASCSSEGDCGGQDCSSLPRESGPLVSISLTPGNHMLQLQAERIAGGCGGDERFVDWSANLALDGSPAVVPCSASGAFLNDATGF
jgi:hypothetical protein